MSLKLFLKDKRKTKENVKFPVTKAFIDEKGNVIEWEIKSITPAVNDKIREDCTNSVPIKGRPNQMTNEVDTSKYIAKLLVASVVFPDLYNADLQDSYGVKTPEELIKELIPSVGEYNRFAEFIQEFNDFKTFEEQVEQAKN